MLARKRRRTSAADPIFALISKARDQLKQLDAAHEAIDRERKKLGENPEVFAEIQAVDYLRHA